MELVLQESESSRNEKIELESNQIREKSDSVKEIIKGVFENEEAMMEFLKNEERTNSVKFRKLNTRKSESTGKRIHSKISPDGTVTFFEYSVKYVCSRSGKAPETPVKRTKKLGACPCKIFLKKYTGTSELFFEYDPNH